MMYSMVAAQPFYTVQKKAISTYVPSFIALAVVINQMNFTMAYTHRFLQSAPAWSPFITPLYIGILFIIQTLRAQREVGDISADELWLLEGFERMYDLRSLLIPGPLVPYFQALAAFSGPFEHLGDVCPRLPTTYPTATDYYCFANGLGKLLPNIPLYMDALLKTKVQFTNPTTATNAATLHPSFGNTMKYFWHNIHSANVTNSQAQSTAMLSPAAWITPHFTEQQYNTYEAIHNHYGFPAPLNVTTSGNMTSLAQFMRFYAPGDSNTFFPWFQNVSSMMQRYSQFFKESVPLSAIPPAGTASGLPVWRFSANANLTTNPTRHNALTATADASGHPAYYSPVHLHSLAATGHHGDETLEEITEQNSALALVNVDVVTLTTWTTPTNAHIRNDGPVWSLPTVRSSPTVDYANAIGQTISLHYHVDTRQT